MKCLILADKNVTFVKKVCSVIQSHGTVKVFHPRLLGKQPETILHSFTHVVIVQTECKYKVAESFGDALQDMAHAAMLGLRLDWLSLAEQDERLMVVPSLPHTKGIPIHHNKKGVFVNVPSPFLGKRHGTFAVALRDSWEFDIAAKTSYGEVVGVVEKSFDNRYLLNLHEEILFGPIGKVIFKNFLAISPNKPVPRRYNLGGFRC